MEKHTQGELINTGIDLIMNSRVICTMDASNDNYKANAARIVKAWNNYDTLKKALEDILEQTRVNNNYADTCAAMKSKAATALQKAKQY